MYSTSPYVAVDDTNRQNNIVAQVKITDILYLINISFYLTADTNGNSHFPPEKGR